GRPNRHLLMRHDIEKQRIQRPDQDRRRGGRQQQIVEQQAAFARDRREQPAALQLRRPPGEQQQRAAGIEAEQQQDEYPTPRVGGKGVHRGQYAGPHQEGADEAQRKGDDGKQDRPGLQRFAL